jgi:hypothetical protein
MDQEPGHVKLAGCLEEAREDRQADRVCQEQLEHNAATLSKVSSATGESRPDQWTLPSPIMRKPAVCAASFWSFALAEIAAIFGSDTTPARIWSHEFTQGQELFLLWQSEDGKIEVGRRQYRISW